MTTERESLLDARDDTVRERIRLRLPGAQREAFDAVMAWEDEMLAASVEMAERLDRLTAALEGIVDAVERMVDPSDPQHKRKLIQSLRLKEAMAVARLTLGARKDAS